MGSSCQSYIQTRIPSRIEHLKLAGKKQINLVWIKKPIEQTNKGENNKQDFVDPQFCRKTYNNEKNINF